MSPGVPPSWGFGDARSHVRAGGGLSSCLGAMLLGWFLVLGHSQGVLGAPRQRWGDLGSCRGLWLQDQRRRGLLGTEHTLGTQSARRCAMEGRAVPCRAVLFCAITCCAVPNCAVPNCAVPCRAVPSRAEPCQASLGHAGGGRAGDLAAASLSAARSSPEGISASPSPAPQRKSFEYFSKRLSKRGGGEHGGERGSSPLPPPGGPKRPSPRCPHAPQAGWDPGVPSSPLLPPPHTHVTPPHACDPHPALPPLPSRSMPARRVTAAAPRGHGLGGWGRSWGPRCRRCRHSPVPPV